MPDAQVDHPSRLSRIVSELREFYGLLPAPPSDAFMLLVWEVLSYQSSPHKRDAAFTALKRNRSLTPDSMSKVAPKKLEESVKLAGAYVEQRLRALRTAVAVFQRDPELPETIKASIPEAQRTLSTLPQMSDGGADRMLLFAGDHLVFPADSGISRVVLRLGYGDPAEAEAELEETLDAYRRACTYLMHHAVATCTEQDPHCHVCPLRHDCPYGQSH